MCPPSCLWCDARSAGSRGCQVSDDGTFGCADAPDPGQAKDAAKQAAKKAQNAAPDLSGVFDRAQRNIDKIGKEVGPFRIHFCKATAWLSSASPGHIVAVLDASSCITSRPD